MKKVAKIIFSIIIQIFIITSIYEGFSKTILQIIKGEELWYSNINNIIINSKEEELGEIGDINDISVIFLMVCGLCIKIVQKLLTQINLQYAEEIMILRLVLISYMIGIMLISIVMPSFIKKIVIKYKHKETTKVYVLKYTISFISIIHIIVCISICLIFLIINSLELWSFVSFKLYIILIEILFIIFLFIVMIDTEYKQEVEDRIKLEMKERWEKKTKEEK